MTWIMLYGRIHAATYFFLNAISSWTKLLSKTNDATHCFKIYMNLIKLSFKYIIKTISLSCVAEVAKTTNLYIAWGWLRVSYGPGPTPCDTVRSKITFPRRVGVRLAAGHNSFANNFCNCRVHIVSIPYWDKSGVMINKKKKINWSDSLEE